MAAQLFFSQHTVSPGLCLQDHLCNIAIVDRIVPSKHARYITTDRNTFGCDDTLLHSTLIPHRHNHDGTLADQPRCARSRILTSMSTAADDISARWNTRLFHWNTCANPSVPDQMCTQRPESHNAHIFNVIGDGRKILEHWNTHFAQSSLGPPDHVQRQGSSRACGVGVCGGTCLSLTCLKMKMSVFQCSSRETTLVDRPGNLRKHTFRRFQFWNPGTLTGTTSVPVCSSVPAVGQIGQLVKAAGAGRGNLRARTARSRGVDRHHLIRSGSWVVNQQVGRPASTDRGPDRRSCGLNTYPPAPSHDFGTLAHRGVPLAHLCHRGVPNQIVAQRPESHSAQGFSAI